MASSRTISDLRRTRTTPTRLLPPPVRRFREHLREIRRVVGETQQQLVATNAVLSQQLEELQTALLMNDAALTRIDAQIDAFARQRRIANAAYKPRSGDSVKLFTSVFDDVKLLPHFLRHYSSAGVDDFYILTAPQFEAEIKALGSEYRLTTEVRDDLAAVAVSDTETIWEMRSRYQDEDEWVVLVDLDEFIEFEDSIINVIAGAEAQGANVVRGLMYDRFSADGTLVDFDPALDLASQYPVRSRFIRDVMDGCDHKAVLVKGRLQGGSWGGQGAGHHIMVGERVAPGMLAMDHYRWAGKSLERLRERCQLAKDSGKYWWVQYNRALKHYDAHGGRFAWQEFGGELIHS